MRPARPTRPTHVRVGPVGLGLVLLAALLHASCAPVHEGPQLGTVPEGLAYTNSIASARVPLARLAKVRQVAYIPMGEARWPLAVIITEYAATARGEDVTAARDELTRRYGRSTEYGEVEPVILDGRQGWGWLETERYRDEVTQVSFTAVVPYEGVSYSVEVSSRKPRLKDGAYLRQVAASFRVRRQTDMDAWVLIVGGLLLAGILGLLWRAQHRPGSATDTVSRLLRR